MSENLQTYMHVKYVNVLQGNENCLQITQFLAVWEVKEQSTYFEIQAL